MKPLGRRAYGSIGHLPNSRLGPSDSSVTDGQYRICCEKTRDKHDKIIVQEKLDGSNVAVALKNNTIYPLTRAGYVANTSPYKQHHLFYEWAMQREDTFRKVLQEGERISGEWLAQAHGTKYSMLDESSVFAAFDIFDAYNNRLVYDDFDERVWMDFCTPSVLHVGDAVSVREMMQEHRLINYGADEVEGLVYRVERHGKVDYLAKYVRPDKVDGKYLESVSGNPPVWNWQPHCCR